MAALFVCCMVVGIKKRLQMPKHLKSLIGDRGGSRTLDPQLRRLLLYPTELPDHPFLH